jgi:hypothetical protein
VIRKNVFLNWWGKEDQSYITLGEDNKSFAEMTNTRIADNLFINNQTRTTPNGEGNLVNRIMGAITIKNADRTTIDHNIETGFMRHGWHGNNTPTDITPVGYLLRVSRETTRPSINGITITNNTLCDYSGRMGYISNAKTNDITEFYIDSNNYYNGGNPIWDVSDKSFYTWEFAIYKYPDAHATYDDPHLESDLVNVQTPHFANHRSIAGGYTSVENERQGLVKLHGTPKAGEDRVVDADKSTASP